MKKEIRVYVVDRTITNFAFDNEYFKFENHEDIIKEAEKTGQVYSLPDFQKAFNTMKVCTDIDCILIK